MRFRGTPGDWVAWYDRDEDGLITQAGIDTADRSVNIAVTTCENIEIEDMDKYNAYVEADTELLAASKTLAENLDNVTAALENVMAHYGHLMPLYDRISRTALAENARILADSLLRRPR